VAIEPGALAQQDRRAAWLIIPLAALLTIILIVFYGLFNTTTVDGESMLPTLRPADKVLLTKDYSLPIRGDIVVIHLPDENGQPHDIVKRVVAVPGDTIEVRDDVAWVNGAREPAHGIVLDPTVAVSRPPLRIPDGEVFVMGDNRPVSLDSRDIGLVPLPDVQGKVAAVFAPITRVRVVN
jgi:signal peptidase I